MKLSKTDFNWDTLKKEIVIKDCMDSLIGHSELFLKYAFMYSEASSVKDEAKWQVEKVFAIIKEGLRRAESSGKITEARLDALTTGSPDYMEAKEEYLKASEKETALKLAMQALSIRKDMLISLSANMREEAFQGISRGSIEDTGVIKSHQALNALDTLKRKMHGQAEEDYDI